MIFKRAVAKLRAQDWTAITIELMIVIVGVFAGTWVANWNEGRAEKRQTARMLQQLKPELTSRLAFFESVKAYYETSGRYAHEALAAWAGDRRVSNAEFVIAAYQASQIYGIGVNSQLWAASFGSDQLRNIDDLRLRRDLSQVLTADYDPVRFDTVTTDYREDVRKVIPTAIQEQIRAQCGDRTLYPDLGESLVVLPKTCKIRLDPTLTARTAVALRAKPELPKDLNWHLAEVATYVASAEALEHKTRKLDDDLSHL